MEFGKGIKIMPDIRGHNWDHPDYDEETDFEYWRRLWNIVRTENHKLRQEIARLKISQEQ